MPTIFLGLGVCQNSVGYMIPFNSTLAIANGDRIVHKYKPMHAHNYELLAHDSLIFKILENHDNS